MCVFLLKCRYWPFHKSVCQRNDFADAIEATEPKSAGWMRRHGKLAVLKDDEVERLERASSAGRTSSGATREQVMQVSQRELKRNFFSLHRETQ